MYIYVVFLAYELSFDKENDPFCLVHLCGIIYRVTFCQVRV